MSERFIRDYSRAASFGVITGAAVLGLVCGTADAGEGHDLDEKIAAVEQQFNDTRNSQIYHEDHQSKFIDQYGAICVDAVMPYTVGNLLADVGEDSVAVDLLGNVAQPCSADPTAVRTAVRDVRETQQALSDLSTYDFDGVHAQLEDLKDEQEADGNFNGLRFGIATGGLLGGVANVLNKRSKRRR